jgi:hypothetical protein
MIPDDHDGDVHVGLAGVAFVALAGAMLTAVPLTPAGLGFVEAGVVGILTVVFAVPAPEAAATALVDRAVTVVSPARVRGDCLRLIRKASRTRPAPTASHGSDTCHTLAYYLSSAAGPDLHHHQAAVHGEDLAGDVRGFVGREEGDRIGNVLDLIGQAGR